MTKTLSVTSINKYKSLLRLFCLNENLFNYNKTFINLHFKISEKNKTFISKETIKTCLCAILWYLKTYHSYNLSLINEYSLFITHLRKSCAYDTKNHLNLKTNIPLWDHFITIRNKWLIEKKYKKHLISCVYTMIEPRRLLDYANMIIIDNKSLVEEYNRNNNTLNYYCIKDKVFVFCYYKTKKKYNNQVINIPEELNNIILSFIYKKKLNINDSLFGVKDFEKLIQTTFNCGVNSIRHSYISNFYDNNKNINYNKIEQIGKNMGHSVETNIGYYKNLNNHFINKKKKFLNYENPNSLLRNNNNNNNKNKIKIIFDDNNSFYINYLIYFIIGLIIS